jgi:hypothetical protein
VELVLESRTVEAKCLHEVEAEVLQMLFIFAKE